MRSWGTQSTAEVNHGGETGGGNPAKVNAEINGDGKTGDGNNASGYQESGVQGSSGRDSGTDSD